MDEETPFCGVGGWASGPWAGLTFAGNGFCTDEINVVPSQETMPKSNIRDLCIEWC